MQTNQDLRCKDKSQKKHRLKYDCVRTRNIRQVQKHIGMLARIQSKLVLLKMSKYNHLQPQLYFLMVTKVAAVVTPQLLSLFDIKT